MILKYGSFHSGYLLLLLRTCYAGLIQVFCKMSPPWYDFLFFLALIIAQLFSSAKVSMPITSFFFFRGIVYFSAFSSHPNTIKFIIFIFLLLYNHSSRTTVQANQLIYIACTPGPCQVTLPDTLIFLITLLIT